MTKGLALMSVVVSLSLLGWMWGYENAGNITVFFSLLTVWMTVVAGAKACRDKVSFHWKHSVFLRWNEAWRNFLKGKAPKFCYICDGFHFFDGVVVVTSGIFILVLANWFVFQIPWWWIFVEMPVFFLVFYQLFFNPFFHGTLEYRPDEFVRNKQG